jgi:hypothetical protein
MVMEDAGIACAKEEASTMASFKGLNIIGTNLSSILVL